MATTVTTASTHILLLAMILQAAASVQAQLLLPPLVTTPSAAGGGQCPPAVVAELGVCVDMQLGRTSPEESDRCCRGIRAQVDIELVNGLVSRRGGSGFFSRRAPSTAAAECLCAAFSISDAQARAIANVNDQRGNIVLAFCGEAPVPGLTCPGSLTG